MMELNKGTALQGGKYEIIRSLGQGGFGITYLAEQVLLRRTVAVKEFFMKDCCERDASTSQVSVGTGSQRELVNKFRGKFIREAQMIASMNHPNIVRVLDVFEENGTAYYVMDHLPGGSLSDKVKREGPLLEHDAVSYINDIASALAYIHARNTVHLDVKPSNVLLDDNGRAVLIDFGISKHYDDAGEQTSSTPVGISKGYAPLEQGRDGDVSQFKPSTDIYALGATFYYLVTGNVPPEASVVNEDGLERPSGISDRIWTAIEQAMQPRRKDRPQNIKEFLSLLDSPNAGSDKAVDKTDGATVDAEVDETTHIENTPPPAPSSTSRPKADSRPDLKQVSNSVSTASPKPKQETKPKPEPVKESKPSKESKKGFPGWLYAVVVAIVVGLIVFFVIPKSKPTPTPTPTFIPPEPVADLPEPEEEKPEEPKISVAAPSATTSSTNMGTGMESGHEWVDLGLSVKWATCNIGASKPEGYGDYYAWGETSTKSEYSESTYYYCNDGDYHKLTKYCNDSGYGNKGFTDGKTKLELSDDVARQKWGGSWRMPTVEEFWELIDNCTWTWTTQNGVNGYKVTSKKSGYTSRSIFLPAAGYRDDTRLDIVGSYGYYWSSSLNAYGPNYAWYVYFNSGSHGTGSIDRGSGRSVRPVCP